MHIASDRLLLISSEEAYVQQCTPLGYDCDNDVSQSVYLNFNMSYSLSKLINTFNQF